MQKTLSILIATAVLVVAGPAAGAEPPGGDSPQAVAARLAKASETKDFAEMAACIDPSSRSEMAQGLILGTTMMVAFAGFGAEMAGEMADALSDDAEQVDSAKEEAEVNVEELTENYRKVLAAHGLEKMMDEDPSEEGDFDQLLEGVDEVALIADLMAFMDGFPGSEESEEEESPMVPTDLTDYQVDGDTATAQGPEGPVHFVKIDGRWYLKADNEGM